MSLVKFRNGNSFPGVPSLWDSFLGKDFFDYGNSSVPGTTLPAVNIVENQDDYQVEVAAPGMKKSDFKIELDNELLVISSTKEERNEEKDSKGNYTRKEFSYQSFKRAFTLPGTVEGEKIQAKYDDGVLRIVIPKKEEAKQKPVRQIEIA